MSRVSKQKQQHTKTSVASPTAAPFRSYILYCALLLAGVFFFYAGAYQYPLIFDDMGLINPVNLPNMATFCTTLEKRCLSYSTFALTYLAAGLDLFWFRFGNVLCHALSTLACFLFLDRLFNAVRRQSPDGAGAAFRAKDRLLAFCGALLFAVHPVAVYAVGYLIQRSTVMATLFSLLCLAAFVHALSNGGRRWLWVSVALYVAALLSKEQAVMLPAVSLAIAILLGKRFLNTRIEKIAVIAAIVVAGVFVTIKTRYAIGTSYEYFLRELRAMYEASGTMFDPVKVYLGSVITQTGLFFKYILLWIVPYPGWMSIDIRTPIAGGPFTWPFVLGAPAFIAYGAAAVWLILRRGTVGLLGLGMLFPWLLFFTEFVTVRIQEPFVLYRSYLWMAGLPAILPFLARRLQPRHIVIVCVVLVVVFGALARERLATFQSDLTLWDDVVQKNTDLSLIFVDRGYSNRAVVLIREGRNDEALRDLEMTIKLNPQSSHAYLNRSIILQKRGEDKQALADIDCAIKLDPNFADAHAERCALLVKMDELDRALESCNTSLKMAPVRVALLNRAVVYARKKRLQEALSDLNTILNFEPEHAITLYNRSMVYRNLGRTAESGQDMLASCRNGYGPACARLQPGTLPAENW